MPVFTVPQLQRQREIANHELLFAQRRLENIESIHEDVRENHRLTLQRSIKHYLSRIEWIDANISNQTASKP